ncbi:MAG TPA: N-acetylmuramoyl-L-alanine amidase [Terriglobales bacterium]|jgi:N-acetylmuramoyl-L-alanine amidase|nr:N-acetylmuramoyl-L-alanine amidase [Terriglobales bacterium]
MDSKRIQRVLRWSAALFALLLPALAVARVHKSGAWADSQFAAAQRMQDALEGQPLEKRTRLDYERVINAYRRIYLGAPTAGRADPSVVAAAQMTEEMGQRFDDSDDLRSAIQQYEFLRREYPGSKFRFDALFRIGEIYKDDLHDKKNADATFEEFLRRYPRNQFAEAARQALAEPAQPTRRSQKDIRAANKDAKAPRPSGEADSDAVSESAQNNSGNQTEVADSRKPSRVIGIRHWSTPDYTRVAIDLEQGVKFESQRIEAPDRIFFDLLNTELDSKLAGRTFDVGDGLLKDIRTAQFKAGRARVVLDLDELSEFDASLVDNPPRLIIDIHNKPLTAAAAMRTKSTADGENSSEASVSDRSSGEVLSAEKVSVEKSVRRNSVVISNGVKKTIVDADSDGPEQPEPLAQDTNKDAANLDSIDLRKIKPASVDTIPSLPTDHAKSGSKSKRKSAAADFDMREAQPTASGDRSLIRALGLKIGKIVIDPGHGGHDTGTIGPTGLEEKDLVLDVSRRLGKLLQTRLGAEIIYTRKDDTFIPLETRTAIANQEAADLFVSVHANSSHDPDARGVETYYLNFTSSPEALEVAARENAVSEKSIHELQDLVKKIALKEKIEESQEFATDVQRSLHTGLAAKSPGQRDRGVKKAPFIVLIGANMPSILAEISFLSNPGDEHRLETGDYRQKIAESLYRGIAKYVSGLSGVKVASKIDKGEGQ